MLGTADDRTGPGSSSPLTSEAGQQDRGAEQSVVTNLYASLREAMASDNPRDAHGNYYQAQGPGRPVTFSTADQWDAEQRAETYRRTYGIRVNDVNIAWTRWTWAGEHKVFEVWGAMTEREWNAAVLADPTPLPVYRVSPDIVDDGGTDSYFDPGRRARRDTAPTVRDVRRLTLQDAADHLFAEQAGLVGSR